MPLLDSLGYGRIPTVPAPGLLIGDKSFDVSHAWGQIPIHLLGTGVRLDIRTPGVRGAADAAPQAMVQELLNRSPDHQWALLSNGLRLRLLRDSTSLAGPAYVEFDLEAIFDGDLFAEFVVLFLLAHVSRLEPLENETGDGGCRLEQWRTLAIKEGIRALEALAGSVRGAIQVLGSGFLAVNPELRDALTRPAAQPGALDARGLNRLLLRLVYRLLFLFVAEDRDALHPTDADPAAVRRYADHYSTARLRQLALRRTGSAHSDVWDGLRTVFDALAADNGELRLALPGLGGLFERDLDPQQPGSLGILERCRLTNESLLEAVRRLSLLQRGNTSRLQRVDYRNLDAEELGSVYESLLEYEPRIDLAERQFTLAELPGNQRKTSGSYYTPSSLTDCLLGVVLDPILDERSDAPDQEAVAGLLAIRVCDPACGSGHFLVAAARRIAKRVASVRTGEAEPPAYEIRHALHEVIDQCVYGVDSNPMAVELTKVSLWMEAMEPGRPLAFLDAQVRVGNSLLGATPALMAEGIPDKAFIALTGDDKALAREHGALNRRERRSGIGQLTLLTADEATNPTVLHERAEQLGTVSGDDLTAVHQTRDRWRALERSDVRQQAGREADAWCAAFVWPHAENAPRPLTNEVFNTLRTTPDRVPADVRELIETLAKQYGFFHWHLEFPGIFTVGTDGGPVANGDSVTGWGGGFTCVVGNPPWERVKLQEKEFFATRDEDIASAPTKAKRGQLIAALSRTNPELADAWQAASRHAEAESLIIRDGGRYPGCGRGDINTYMVFTEAAVTLIEPRGSAGVIVPTQIATGDTTADFFSGLVTSERLVALHDFENEAKLFPGVHNQQRFCVFAISGLERTANEIAFSFFARHPAQVPELMFRLKPDEITLLNPNTGTCPVFRTRRDAEITLGIYRRHPVLVRGRDEGGNPWGVRFSTMLHMANDSDLFHIADDLQDLGAKFNGWSWTMDDERYLPLYEAKMVHHYDHRFSTYEDATQAQLNKGTLPRLSPETKADPTVESLARYWVDERDLLRRLEQRRERGERPDAVDRDWFIGWRDIARSVDSRTFIGSLIPRAAVPDGFLLMAGPDALKSSILLAAINSFVFDYVTRQKMTLAHVKFYLVRQLPVPSPAGFAESAPWTVGPLDHWIWPRVLELVYTSWAVEAFARDCGDGGPPFVWDEKRRGVLRAELDAAMFHVYGLDRDEVEHVMDSFWLVSSAKQPILEVYDAMAEAAADRRVYLSPLDPAPGVGQRHPAGSRPDR